MLDAAGSSLAFSPILRASDREDIVLGNTVEDIEVNILEGQLHLLDLLPDVSASFGKVLT